MIKKKKKKKDQLQLRPIDDKSEKQQKLRNRNEKKTIVSILQTTYWSDCTRRYRHDNEREILREKLKL